MYQLQTAHDLLQLLQSHRKKGVMEVKTLKDSFPNIQPAIDELVQEKKIIVIPGKEGQPRLLYPDEPEAYIPLSQEYKDLWEQVKVPDSDIMIRELEKGLIFHKN